MPSIRRFALTARLQSLSGSKRDFMVLSDKRPNHPAAGNGALGVSLDIRRRGRSMPELACSLTAFEQTS